MFFFLHWTKQKDIFFLLSSWNIFFTEFTICQNKITSSFIEYVKIIPELENRIIALGMRDVE